MKKLIIGTHILKKTAHLFAFWGFNRQAGEQFRRLTALDEANVQHSARHTKKSRQTTTYLGDSGVLFELCKTLHKNDPRHMVGTFRGIRIEVHPQFEVLNRECARHSRPITELAHWFIHDQLGISPELLPRYSVLELWKKAIGFVPNRYNAQEYEEILFANMPLHMARKAILSINRVAASRVETEIHRYSQLHTIPGRVRPHGPSASALTADSSLSPADAASPDSITATSSDQPASKRRKHNPEDVVDCRTNWKEKASERKLPKLELVTICCGAIDEIVSQKDSGKTLVDPLKTWANRASKVVACVKGCHANSKEAFVHDNPTFTISKFGTCSKGVKHSAHIPSKR